MSKTCRFRKGLAGVLVVSFLAACVPYQGTSAAEGEWVKYYKNTYYNLKKLWVCLQLDEQGNIIGWREENVSVQPDQSKWIEWGIP